MKIFYVSYTCYGEKFESYVFANNYGEAENTVHKELTPDSIHNISWVSDNVIWPKLQRKDAEWVD